MRAVCDAWEQFLEPGSFDRDLTFEASGGDSLKGLNLLLFLETRLGRHIGPSVLDMTSRPSELIARLQRAPDANDAPGPGDARPLLFVFAGMYGADVTFKAFADQLQPRFSPVVVDFGWGGSEFDGTFSADRLFDAIIAIARRNLPRRSITLGHSYGGKLAAEAARRLIAAGLAVEAVVILDGVREDRFLRREADARRGVILADRVRRGARQHEGLANYVGGRLARRLAVRLVTRRQYRRLNTLMRVLRWRALRRVNEQAWRAVTATVRLDAFAGMPPSPIATKLLLLLSNEERFEGAPYPHLGWQTYFNSVETVRVDAAHLDMFKDEHKGAVMAALSELG